MDGMLDWEFQGGRLRTGLFCRELLPPPASAQLPVLGKRLWLLQTRGHQAGHCQTQLSLFPGGHLARADVGKACPGPPHLSLRFLLWYSAITPEWVGVPIPDPHGGVRQTPSSALFCVVPALNHSFCFPTNIYLSRQPLGALKGIIKGNEKNREVDQKCLPKIPLCNISGVMS